MTIEEKLKRLEEHVLKRNGIIDIVKERQEILISDCKFLKNHMSTMLDKLSKVDDRLDKLVNEGITAKAQVSMKLIGLMATIATSITAIILAIL